MNSHSLAKRPETWSSASQPWLRRCSIGTLVVSAGLLCVSLPLGSYHASLVANLIPSLLAVLSFAVFLNVYSLWNFRREHREADRAFRYADCEFSSIFQNVLDGILIVDDTGNCLDANPAAAAILRFSSNDLIGQNVGRFLVGSSAVVKGWNACLLNKNHRGRARLLAGDGTNLFVDFTATANYLPGRHALVICDVTERTQAALALQESEERFREMADEQLGAVETARAEAEALRRATLALSQNLSMDSVLDTLLQCISELVPFNRATVLFVEDGFELMVAREAPRIVPKRMGFTLTASENLMLERVLFEKTAVLVSDVATQSGWRDMQPLDHLKSWLGIPLVAAGRVLGILSLGSSTPGIFTAEHLRLAKSLAIPAAVAIQNARTHERAELYAAELQIRLREVHNGLEPVDNAERKSFRSKRS